MTGTNKFSNFNLKKKEGNANVVMGFRQAPSTEVPYYPYSYVAVLASRQYPNRNFLRVHFNNLWWYLNKINISNKMGIHQEIRRGQETIMGEGLPEWTRCLCRIAIFSHTWFIKDGLHLRLSDLWYHHIHTILMRTLDVGITMGH